MTINPVPVFEKVGYQIQIAKTCKKIRKVEKIHLFRMVRKGN